MHPSDHQSNFRSGMLTIRIFSGQNFDYSALFSVFSPDHRWFFYILGRGLSLAPGAQIPDVIKKALESGPPPRTSTSNRESMQRRRYWWLPYVVLEFDKNEVLIDALGGDLANPVWNFRADLCAYLNPFPSFWRIC
jgi:serum/glucocorticoid-regulated kinase 2